MRSEEKSAERAFKPPSEREVAQRLAAVTEGACVYSVFRVLLQSRRRLSAWLYGSSTAPSRREPLSPK